MLCAILALSASNASSEQQGKPPRDYALIFGTVWTPDMHAASGVPILIRRADEKKPRWHLVSDRSGEFAQRVPPAGSTTWFLPTSASLRVPNFPMVKPKKTRMLA
jgi:hypothetical protein